MFKTLEEAQAFIGERNITMVDLKFCDLWGRWHHLTIPATQFGPRLLSEGIGFDGSSVGFKSVHAGDMVMVPDLSTAAIDPFWDMPTLSLICSAQEVDTRAVFPYDPRNIALRAEAYLRASGIADFSLWGPEFEFYVFDRISYQNRINSAFYRVESAEAEWATQEPGSGYTIPLHGGDHAIPPQDRLYNLRSRISQHLLDMGLEVKYHHHEVGGPGQCEIETPMLPLIRAADGVMLVKYVSRMTTFQEGMSVTFMPKPLYGEAGSGMHCHQNLWKEGHNLFYDPAGYGALGELGRYYIGGLLYHGGAVMALTNPSTNSYRRLVPGYEAPISAIYSLGNRSAAIRIPQYANRPDSARFEFRPPDATCNPYLAMAAQLRAGLDGILKRIDPSEMGFGPVDEDIFTWSAERRRGIKALPTWLGAAMDALEADHDFLLVGDVFSRELIWRWIERKRWEEHQVAGRPHPYEIELYYDL